jgi:hypothetical protein
MSENGLMIVSLPPSPERRLTRYALFAFAGATATTRTNDDAGSIWIVDSGGVLILPADQVRLNMKVSADPA